LAQQVKVNFAAGKRFTKMHTSEQAAVLPVDELVARTVKEYRAVAARIVLG
jgi:hypothetical protein